MDVARAHRDSFGNYVVDQFYHRPLRLLLVQLILGCVDPLDDGLSLTGVGAPDQFADALDRRVYLFDPFLNATGGGEQHSHVAGSSKGESLLAIEIVRVGCGDLESRVREGEWEDSEPAREAFRHPFTSV